MTVARRVLLLALLLVAVPLAGCGGEDAPRDQGPVGDMSDEDRERLDGARGDYATDNGSDAPPEG